MKTFMTKICEDKGRNLFNKCFALDYTLMFILNTTEIKNNNSCPAQNVFLLC